MIIKTKTNKEIYVLEVPSDTYWFRYKKMTNGNLHLVASVRSKEGHEGTCYIAENPQGVILGLLKYLSEEICRKFVESKRIKKSWNSDMSDVYINYKSDHVTNMYTDLAQESLVSYLESKGINTNKNLLIIEL